jgi:hypothetical protein
MFSRSQASCIDAPFSLNEEQLIQAQLNRISGGYCENGAHRRDFSERGL